MTEKKEKTKYETLVATKSTIERLRKIQEKFGFSSMDKALCYLLGFYDGMAERKPK